ncbi:monocarboxylate transporter 13 [Clonorchis sinensis]|uniref:Monocarboxylate transporter 13 n=1 Tax=Clonorchis sinensis TaxID=79923 RepID=H2KPS6_CLOSI|nr:monocarboxylate transporter 13 [Clonorchis sinensis]
MRLRVQFLNRGRAWICDICAFLLVGMHYGILNCGSLYYPGMAEATGYPISVVIWLVTGQFAIAFCFAPVYNKILDMIPYCIATSAAAVLTSIGIITATFLHNYFAFMIPFTIVGGIGLGISLVRVLAIVAEHFDRYRVFALALAASGAGFGTFVYSALGAQLIETFTWRVALMIIGALHLNIIPLNLVLRLLPPEPFRQTNTLVANQPNLSTSEGEKKRSQSGTILSLSGFSIMSKPDGVASPAQSVCSQQTDTSPRNLKVVVEFFQASETIVDQSHVPMSSLTLFSEANEEILDMIRQLANETPAEAEIEPRQTLIPIVFVFGKIRNSGLFDLGQLQNLWKPVVFRDGFAVAMMSKYDRSQVWLRRAESRIQELTHEFNAQDIGVSPARILVMINRLDNQMQSEYPNFGSGDRPGVRFVYDSSGESPTLKEAESDDVRTDGTRAEDKPEADTNPIINAKTSHVSSIPSLSATSRGLTIPTNSSVELSMVRGRTTDMTEPINNPEDSVNYPTPKPEAIEPKSCETAAAQKNMPNFIQLDLMFLSFLLSRTIGYITDSVVLAHLSNFGLSLGFGTDEASRLLTYVGVTAMLGRFFNAFVGQLVPNLDMRIYISVCMFLLSTGMIIMPSYPTKQVLSAFAIVYGFLMSPSFVLAPGLTYEIIGPERYEVGVAFLFQFEAMGFLIGGPVGGIIKEISDRYYECFMFGAAAGFITGLILVSQRLWLSLRFHQCLSQGKKVSNEMSSETNGDVTVAVHP